MQGKAALAALALAGAVGLMLFKVSSDDPDGRSPARGSRVGTPAEVRSAAPLSAERVTLPLARPADTQPAPKPKPSKREPPPSKGAAQRGAPSPGRDAAGDAPGRLASDPTPGPRPVKLDLFMTPTQLHVSGVFPRGREVAGIRVDIAVSFGDTKVPLGHTRCALDPQGALLLTLYTRSNLTRVEPDPAQGRGDRAGVLRFPPARYQVEATLHMAAQLPGVRDDLMRAFGWGETARILLGEGSIVFGGEGAALGLRAESLRQLEELVPALERAASQARPAVLGEVQLREFTGALDLGVPPRRYFVGQLRSYVALPDQDLLNTARAAATLLVEFDRLIQQRGLTGVHRELKSVEETRDSLQRLLPELKLRGDAVLGR